MNIDERLASLEAAIKELTAVLKGKAGGGASKADEAIEKEAARKAAASGTKGKITAEAYSQRFKDYISVEDEDEQQTRIANIQKIAKKFNVKKPSLIDESDWPAALKMLKGFEDAAKASDDGDDDEGGESIV